MSLDSIVTSLYLLTLGCLALYGLHRVWLVACFRWPRDAGAQPEQGGELPLVTVQLPLFNERTVAARLIRSVGAFDYPPGRLEIQVLDDSSDETCAIVDQEVAALRSRGLDAKVLRRAERTGFKAGALEQGSRVARGELLCIFDADFRPGPDFLRRMVPAFRDPRIGMVQARWEHENRDETLLTRAGSALLDGHFVVEHKVRFDHDLFFNFNGTAGIWRREAIERAGGWQHDTLTEDLDLSYRAQLVGWRFHYAHAVTAPAEVPADISSFKSQQHRWARGSVQVARKLIGRILAADLPVRTKLEAWAHLTGNIGYPLVLLLAALLPLVARAGSALPDWLHLSAFAVCTLSVMLFYERSQRAIGRSLRQRLLDVPLAMALGIGMCVSQTRAVLGGLVRAATGEFVRTPKRGGGAAALRYRAALSGWPGIELVFAAWFGWALVSVLRARSWGALPFLLLFFWGFAWVGTLSLHEWLSRRPLSRRADGARSRAGAHVPARG